MKLDQSKVKLTYFSYFFRAAWHALKSTPNFPTFTAPTTNTFSENVVNHTDITASLGGSIPLIKRLQNLAEFARNCTLFLRKSSCDMKLSSVVIHAPAYCKYNFTPFYSTLIDDCWALKEIFKWNIKIVRGIYHDRSSSSAATIDNWNFSHFFCFNFDFNNVKNNFNDRYLFLNILNSLNLH